MARLTFEIVLNWLREERRTYQTKKFDYKHEPLKPVEYWTNQQFQTYITRIQLFGLEDQRGFQAALKLAATAVALCEHYADREIPFPKPGLSSGNLEDWVK